MDQTEYDERVTVAVNALKELGWYVRVITTSMERDVVVLSFGVIVHGNTEVNIYTLAEVEGMVADISVEESSEISFVFKNREDAEKLYAALAIATNSDNQKDI